jgi:hypothetical protein
MNVSKSKRFIVTILTFVMFMALVQPTLLTAEERRGSTVEVTMTDGSLVKGELLAVKTDALLIYDQAAGQGNSIDLQQVVQVKVMKKSKFLRGMFTGLAVGMVIGSDPEKNVHIDYYWLKTWLNCAIIGGLLEALTSADKKFTLAEVSPEIRQKKLEWLERFAREQDFEKGVGGEFFHK